MTMKQTLAQRALTEQLNKNENPTGFKILIKQVMKGVQDRSYWYFTADQAEFLSKVYVKQVEEQMLRRSLKKITDQAMDQLFTDFFQGNLAKVAVQHDVIIATVKIYEKAQTIANSGQEHYTDEHSIAKQTQQKIRQINQDYKSFKDKVDSIKQRQRQKHLQKQAMQKQIQQKIAEQKKLQYHKEVMKRLEIMKIKQEQRNQQNQKFKMFLKEFKKSKPLHQLMEQEYKEKVQLPHLEESRKKLELYKHKKKPTLQQINDHQRAYMTIKQSKPEKNFIQHQTIDVGYKSHFYKKIEEEDKEGFDDQYSSMVWDQLEKKKRYSLMVKQNHKPKTSRIQLSSSIDESRKQNSQRKIVPDLSRVRQIGKFYLEYVKSLQKNRTVSNQKQEFAQQQARMSRSRYTNYLQDLKKNNEGKSKGFGSNWQADLNDRTASKSQKRDRIMIKSKQLQQKAMRQETFIKNFNYGKAQDIIGRKKQIDETLLEAIKAKMALLKEVRSD